MIYKIGMSDYKVCNFKHIFAMFGFRILNKNNYYDDELYNIVKKYQKINDLVADGIIGKKTISQMQKDLVLMLKAYKDGKDYKKYIKYNIDNIVIVDSPPKYEDLIMYFGDPTKNSVSFEKIYVRRCDLSHLREYYSHVKLFNHRNWFGFRCHKYLIDIFTSVFEDIAKSGYAKHIKTFDGCFNVRFMRKGRKWSTHSWAIAIDLNAKWNPLGCKKPEMHPAIIQIFKDYKFTWGGDWSYPDPMHFQYCK